MSASTRKAVGRASQLGKPTNFEEAYARHKDRLLTLAAALTGDQSDAEDVLHDVFASFVKEPWRLADRKLPAYLTVCVRNRARDLNRQRRRRKHPTGKGDRIGVGALPQDPSEQAAHKEESKVLLELVKRLSTSLREVVALRIWGELSFEEIANLQKTSKSTAHARYSQALEKLRLELEKRGFQDG